MYNYWNKCGNYFLWEYYGNGLTLTIKGVELCLSLEMYCWKGKFSRISRSLQQKLLVVMMMSRWASVMMHTVQNDVTRCPTQRLSLTHCLLVNFTIHDNHDESRYPERYTRTYHRIWPIHDEVTSLKPKIFIVQLRKNKKIKRRLKKKGKGFPMDTQFKNVFRTP